MKRISLLTLFLLIFCLHHGTVFSADLSSNIMRRVNTANQDLDKAEEQIRTGRSEHATSKLNGARKEYDNIFNYYKGSFDPNHPTILQLKDRIETVTVQLSKAAAPVAADENVNNKTEQKSALSANIQRRIANADRQLVWVNQAAAKGDEATGSLSAAKVEYNNIFQYYKGSFDPDHPEIVALKGRIDAAEKAMKAGIAQKNAATPIEQNSRVVDDLPPQVGKSLLKIAGSLRTLENRLNTAATSNNPGSYVEGVKSDLKIATDQYIRFNSNYEGKFDTHHTAYIQVKTRLKNDQTAVARLETKARSIAAADNESLRAANNAAEKKIMGQYKNLEPTSTLHRNNPGRMVWSTKPINIGDQDTTPLQDSFRLTDPIFGRIYLFRSLGNTPVYGKNGKGTRPEENSDFRYEYRLYIDGQELVDKFSVFASGKLNGEAGESWTTWQFAPNPLPFDAGFKNEADAWRRVTQGLSAGTHSVRFELWGAQGQFRSNEPISIGEFSLIVGQGDRVAAGSPFPGDNFTGGDLNTLRSAISKAIVGPVAKNSAEILKVAVTSDWKVGVYSDTKRQYRIINGTILWHDTNNDSVCRFTTYNFISNHSGGNNWTPLRFKSFCLGCLEGDTECP